MIDQRLSRAAVAAEEAVPLPDIAEIRRRGARLRRQRTAAVAVACAGVLGLGSLVVAADQDPRADDPVTPPRPFPSATPWPEGVAWTSAGLAPGSYRIELGENAPVAQLTVPPGWRVWEGPVRFEHGDPAASVVVVKVLGVHLGSCAARNGGIRQVGGAPSDLVRALRVAPGHHVVLGPVADDRFGYPATHLRLRVEKTAHCPGRVGFALLDTADGLIGGPDPGGTVDLWVVDVDGQTAVVFADAVEGVSVRTARDQRAIVASIELAASSS